MPNFILHNDVLKSDNEAVLTANNRAFKFGDGLFESMRMCQNRLQFAELHADRLQAGMQALKLEGYALFDTYFLKQKTAELTKKNKIQGNARFRITVYREGEGRYAPESNKAGYVLEALPLTSASYELNTKGLIVDVYDELTKPVNRLSNFKTLNALHYVMAGLFQKQYRLDEAVLLNQHGFLCETTSSNIFVVYDGQIYTPALSEGCVGGVMRSMIIRLAKLHELPLVEAQINPEILNQAEEVFITNAVSGIRWVMGYGRKRYFNEVARDLNLKLNMLIQSGL